MPTHAIRLLYIFKCAMVIPPQSSLWHIEPIHMARYMLRTNLYLYGLSSGIFPAYLLCFPLEIKTKSVLLFCSISFSWSNQSIHWEDCLVIFTYNVFLTYSSLYICNYFYIAFPEVSDSIQIPEMLFCLQQMLREVYGISKDPVSLVTFSKFACQHGAVHHQRHHRPVHGERGLEENNLCILSFCFEYMDKEKIAVNISISGR